MSGPQTDPMAQLLQRLLETTPLPPEKAQAFQAWITKHKITDLDKPGSNYDYRGAFLAGAKPVMVPNPKTGVLEAHWKDTWKQHGHETFSVESKYSNGPTDGGHWEGNVFIPPKK